MSGCRRRDMPPSMDGRGHGDPLGHTLIEMIDEYALHSGQAHMLRFPALGNLER